MDMLIQHGILEDDEPSGIVEHVLSVCSSRNDRKYADFADY